MQQITSREWQQYSLLSVSGWRVTKLLSCGCVLARDQGNEFWKFLVLVFFGCLFSCLSLLSHGTRDAHSCRSHISSHESSQARWTLCSSHLTCCRISCVIMEKCRPRREHNFHWMGLWEVQGLEISTREPDFELLLKEVKKHQSVSIRKNHSNHAVDRPTMHVF